MTPPSKEHWDQVQVLISQQFTVTQELVGKLAKEHLEIRQQLEGVREVLQGTLARPDGLLHQVSRVKYEVYGDDEREEKGLVRRVGILEGVNRAKDLKEWYYRGWLAGAAAVGVLLAKMIGKHFGL